MLGWFRDYKIRFCEQKRKKKHSFRHEEWFIEISFFAILSTWINETYLNFPELNEI